MVSYSIVIPVYNAEKSLKPLHDRISNVFETIIKEPFEMVLVDDSSTDESYQVITELANADNRVTGIQLAKNHGQQKAVLCGIRYAKGDFIITMDDDLQHPPEEIPVLIEKINSSKDIDVVVGAYAIKKHGLIRKMGSRLMDFSSNLIFKKPKGLKLTSFRIMRRFVADSLNTVSIFSPTVGPLLLQTTTRIVNVTIRHDERYFGKSGYTFKKLCRIFIKNVLTNSDIPLKIIGNIGILSFVSSIFLILYYLLKFLIHGSSIHGWTTSIIMLLFFGGTILFSIGIIGHYLANIMQETKKMPPFIIRRIDTNNKEEK